MDTNKFRRRLVYPRDYNHTHFELEGAIVLGDPNMPTETREALAKLIRCAQKAIEAGTLGKQKGQDDGTANR